MKTEKGRGRNELRPYNGTVGARLIAPEKNHF